MAAKRIRNMMRWLDHNENRDGVPAELIARKKVSSAAQCVACSYLYVCAGM
jgi:radical SAM protein with 4Fe4S-binding SPASM domain